MRFKIYARKSKKGKAGRAAITAVTEACRRLPHSWKLSFATKQERVMLAAKQIAQNSELLPVKTTMTSRKNRGGSSRENSKPVKAAGEDLRLRSKVVTTARGNSRKRTTAAVSRATLPKHSGFGMTGSGKVCSSTTVSESAAAKAAP